MPDSIIPRIFPTYALNPNGQNFGLFCNYQLLRYQPWRTTQNNAWGDREPTDEALINCWHEFLQTPYGQSRKHIRMRFVLFYSKNKKEIIPSVIRVLYEGYTKAKKNRGKIGKG